MAIDWRACLGPAGPARAAHALVAELLATALLVMLGCMACLPEPGKPNLLQIGLGFGFVILANVQIFGHVSGAHMNPAVTLAAVLLRVMPPLLGVGYVLAQCVGAVLGFGLLVLLSPFGLRGVNGAAGVCSTVPFFGISDFQALMTEGLLTGVLVLLCGSLWDPGTQAPGAGPAVALKFGLVVSGLIYVGGPLTGASMNPARSLGPAVWNGDWEHHWVYWLGPLGGAALAAMLYRYVLRAVPAPVAALTPEDLPLRDKQRDIAE